MNKNQCEPCSRLSKNNEAEYWCASCQDRLCVACLKYHKALGVTKHHSIITVDKYHSILPALESATVTCTEHPDRVLDYFCREHEKPCCLSCKRTYHNNCKETEKIEEVINDMNMQEEFKKIYDRVHCVNLVLKKLISNRDHNISNLNEQKKLLYNNLKTNRQKIDRALDKYESDIKAELERSFHTQEEKLSKQRDSFKEEQTHLETCEDLVKCITDIENISGLPFFLIKIRNNERITEKEKLVDLFKASLKETSSECCVEIDIHEKTYSINVRKTIAFQENECILNTDIQQLETEEEIETNSSSTAEAEEYIDKLETVSENPGIPILPHSTQTDNGDMKFQFKKEFKLAHTNLKPESGTRFVNVLPKNRLLVGDDARVLIYSTGGEKLGEIKLLFPATSAAVVDETEVIVAAYRAAVVLDTKLFRFTDIITMGDNCYGIAVMENKLVVNCSTKGLCLMDMFGNPIKSFKYITGQLRLCPISRDILAFVKQDSSTIGLLNIKTGEITENLVKLSGVKYIANDRSGGTFVTLKTQNKVFHVSYDNVHVEEILNKEDKLEKPLGIDFDIKSNQLFVVNQNGQAICIFEKVK